MDDDRRLDLGLDESRLHSLWNIAVRSNAAATASLRQMVKSAIVGRIDSGRYGTRSWDKRRKRVSAAAEGLGTLSYLALAGLGFGPEVAKARQRIRADYSAHYRSAEKVISLMPPRELFRLVWMLNRGERLDKILRSITRGGGPSEGGWRQLGDGRSPTDDEEAGEKGKGAEDAPSKASSPSRSSTPRPTTRYEPEGG